jgi:hypothetical protein
LGEPRDYRKGLVEELAPSDPDYSVSGGDKPLIPPPVTFERSPIAVEHRTALSCHRTF